LVPFAVGALIVTGVADDNTALSEIRLVLKECGPAVNNEKFILCRLLHQHYIESQPLVGQLLLPSCCYCTSRSVVAPAVGEQAVGCALIVTPGELRYIPQYYSCYQLPGDKFENVAPACVTAATTGAVPCYGIDKFLPVLAQ
jgi:hypothetical protein